jgi:hypothetical protein
MNNTHTSVHSWRTRDALRSRTRPMGIGIRFFESVAGFAIGVPAALGAMYLVASLGTTRFAMSIGPAMCAYFALLGLPVIVAALLPPHAYRGSIALWLGYAAGSLLGPYMAIVWLMSNLR